METTNEERLETVTFNIAPGFVYAEVSEELLDNLLFLKEDLVEVDFEDIKHEHKDCGICHMPFDESREDPHSPVRMPCSELHVFGKKCITTWLQPFKAPRKSSSDPVNRVGGERNNCPMCRFPFFELQQKPETLSCVEYRIEIWDFAYKTFGIQRSEIEEESRSKLLEILPGFRKQEGEQLDKQQKKRDQTRSFLKLMNFARHLQDFNDLTPKQEQVVRYLKFHASENIPWFYDPTSEKLDQESRSSLSRYDGFNAEEQRRAVLRDSGELVESESGSEQDENMEGEEDENTESEEDENMEAEEDEEDDNMEGEEVDETSVEEDEAGAPLDNEEFSEDIMLAETAAAELPALTSQNLATFQAAQHFAAFVPEAFNYADILDTLSMEDLESGPVEGSQDIENSAYISSESNADNENGGHHSGEGNLDNGNGGQVSSEGEQDSKVGGHNSGEGDTDIKDDGHASSEHVPDARDV